MDQNYDASLTRLLVHEGGYSNHPSDPGGPTNWGITLQDARMYWKADATATDVRNMPLVVAKSIYKSKYWLKMSCDKLPNGVDYATFDYGVNSGVGRAAKVLQRLVEVPVDGSIGSVTVAAALKRDPVKLVSAMCDERLTFLHHLSTWSVFGTGWSRRVREVRAFALQLARTPALADASKLPPVPTAPAATPPGLVDDAGKGTVPPVSTATTTTVVSTGTAVTVAPLANAGMLQWAVDHYMMAGLFVVGMVFAVSMVLVALNRWRTSKAETPMLVPPVPAIGDLSLPKQAWELA